MLSATRRCLFSGATRTAASAPAVGAAAVRQLQLRTVRTQPSIGRVARPAYGAEQQSTDFDAPARAPARPSKFAFDEPSPERRAPAPFRPRDDANRSERRFTPARRDDRVDAPRSYEKREARPYEAREPQRSFESRESRSYDRRERSDYGSEKSYSPRPQRTYDESRSSDRPSYGQDRRFEPRDQASRERPLSYDGPKRYDDRPDRRDAGPRSSFGNDRLQGVLDAADFDRAPRRPTSFQPERRQASSSYEREDRRPSSYDRDDRRPRPSLYDRDDDRPRVSRYDRDDDRPRATRYDRDERGPPSYGRDDRRQSSYERDDRGPSSFERDDRRLAALPAYRDRLPAPPPSAERASSGADKRPEERSVLASKRDNKVRSRTPKTMAFQRDSLFSLASKTKLPAEFPEAPEDGARFFATFRGLEFGVARKAYQNYLYQGGCKTVKFYDVGIKDTAMFTVESPKELWLAYDELKAPGVELFLKPPSRKAKVSFGFDLWIVKAPVGTKKADVKGLLRKCGIFKVTTTQPSDGFRLRFVDDETRAKVVSFLGEKGGFETTRVEPASEAATDDKAPEAPAAEPTPTEVSRAAPTEAEAAEHAADDALLDAAREELRLEEDSEGGAEASELVEEPAHDEQAAVEEPVVEEPATENPAAAAEPAVEDTPASETPDAEQPSSEVAPTGEEVAKTGETKGQPPIS